MVDADVHVHAAGSARLRPAAQPKLGQQLARDERDAPNVVPRHARAGIEVDPQLVGMVEIVRADGVRMELETTEVHDPRQACRIVDDDFLGGAS